MFLEPSELKSAIYQYQLNEIVEITEEDDTNEDIIQMAISAAVEEVKSYLTPNNQSQVRYDVVAIFSATGDARNALILEICKTIAVWYICRLSNVDIILEKVRERYDRAIKWLERVSGTGSGTTPGTTIIVTGLPTISDPDNVATLPFRFGSREKFNHE